MIELVADAAPARARPWRRLVPATGAVLAVATVLVGEWIKAAGGHLGVDWPPFYVRFAPAAAGSWAPAAVGILLLAAATTPRWLWRVRHPLALACALYLLSLALGIGLNVLRGGVHDLWRIFDTAPGGSREAAQEYLPGLPALSHGVRFYVRHFAALIPRLPVHVKGNPPGPLVALHLLGIHTAPALAALCVGLGAVSAPLAYDLGRTLGGEQRGRLAGVLTAFAPSLLLWGVTSADYAFATLGLVPACLLVRRNDALRAIGALAAAAATFFSWLLFAMPGWALLVVLRRDGARRAAGVALAFVLAVAAVYGALAVALGYDPVGTLQATDAAYRHGIPRPYAYWLVGSPTAWAIALGLPVAWLWLRALAAADSPAVALFAIMATSSVLGFTKAETERIWLPFVPLAAVAAAGALPPRRLPSVLWLLVGQALAIELLFDTIW